MIGLIVASLLFSAVCSAPAGPPAYHAPIHHAPAYHAPQPSYHPAPKYEEVPQPYEYAYGVKDEYSGTNIDAAEGSDGKVVTGHYSVLLPDGRLQNVKYTADHYAGYIADVSYEGYAKVAPVHAPVYHAAPKPVYHPAPKPVYHPAPIHKPAPVYHAAPVYQPAPVYHG